VCECVRVCVYVCIGELERLFPKEVTPMLHAICYILYAICYIVYIICCMLYAVVCCMLYILQSSINPPHPHTHIGGGGRVQGGAAQVRR
jgi:hypothetical protein